MRALGLIYSAGGLKLTQDWMGFEHPSGYVPGYCIATKVSIISAYIKLADILANASIITIYSINCTKMTFNTIGACSL